MSYDPYSGFSQSYGGTTFDQDQLRVNTRFSSLFNLSSSVSAENILQLAESPDALGSAADILASTDKMTWLNEFKRGLENEKKESQVSAWNSLPNPYRQALIQIGYKEPKIELSIWQKALGTVVKGFQAIPGSDFLSKAISLSAGNVLRGFTYSQNVLNTLVRTVTYDVGQGNQRFLLRMEKAGDLLKSQGFDLSPQELDAIRNKYVKEFGIQDLGDGLTEFAIQSVLKINPYGVEGFVDTNPWDDAANTPVNNDAYTAFIELERSLRKDENLGDSSFFSSWKRTYNGEEYIRPADQLRQYKKLQEAGFVPQAFDFALHLGQGKTIEEYILKNQKNAQGDKIEIGSPEFIEARKILSTYMGDPTFKSAVDALKSKYARVSPGRQLADATPLAFFKDTPLYDTVSGAGDLVYQLVFDPTIVLGKALKVSNVIKKGVAAVDLPRVTSVVKALKVAEEAGADLSSPTLNVATQKILRDSQLKQPVNEIFELAHVVDQAQFYLPRQLKSNFPYVAAEFQARTGMSVDVLQNIFFRGDNGKLYIDKNFFAGLEGSAKDTADEIIVAIDNAKKSLNVQANQIRKLGDLANSSDIPQLADDAIENLDILRTQMQRTDFTIFDVKFSKTADRLRVTQAQKTKRWVDRINTAFIEMRDNPDNASDVLNRLKDDLPQGPTIVTALMGEHQRLLSAGGSGLDDYDNILEFINDSYRMFATGVGTKLYTRGFGRTTVPEKYRIWGGGEKSINYEPLARNAKLGKDRGVPGIYLAMPEITRGGEFSRAFLRKADEIFDAMGVMKIKHQTIAGRVITKPFRVIGNGLWNLTNHGPSSQIISVVGDEFGQNVLELINVSRMSGFTRAQRENLFYQAVTGKIDVAEGVKRMRFKNPPVGVTALVDAVESALTQTTLLDQSGIELDDISSSVKTFLDAISRVVNEYGSFRTSTYLNTPDYQDAWKNFVEYTDTLDPGLVDSDLQTALLRLRSYFEDEVVSEELFGNLIASRFYILDSFYDQLFKDLGITEELLTDTVYGNGESIIRKLSRYRNRQTYAPAGLDRVKINEQVFSWPVLPVAQYSDQMAIPDTRLLLKHMQNLSVVQRAFRWSFGSEFLDTVMGRYWKPITLIRLGFVPRAAGEEMFAFFARDGFNIVPALAARYASRETRGLLTGLVNKLGQGVAGTGRLLGNMDLKFWTDVAESELEKEVWEFSFAMQFQRRAEYLQMLRKRVQEQLGKNQLTKSDHIQATAAWITASLTRYFRNNIIKMLPQEMKNAMVVIATPEKLGIYKGFEALQPTLYEAANVLARTAFYQQTIADDIMTIGSGIPESRFEDMATREVTARNLRTGDDRTVKVRVGREFVELDSLSDGDLEKLSYWYTQVGNDPVAMEALRAGIRGSLTEGQMYELQDLLTRTGFHVAPTGVPEGVSAFWVDPVTGEYLNVNDEIVQTFGVPLRGLFYDASDPLNPTAPTGFGLEESQYGWFDPNLEEISAVSGRDFVDSLVASAESAEVNRTVQDSFINFQDAIDSNLSVQFYDSSLGSAVEKVSLQPIQVPFWFYNYDRESVVSFIESRVTNKINASTVETGVQVINPLVAKESAERIVDELVDRALQDVPSVSLSNNSLRSALSQVVDLYRNDYITQEQLSAYLDNVSTSFRQATDQKTVFNWNEIENALSEQPPNFETARGLVRLYTGSRDYNPNAIDVDNLSDDDLLSLSFEDFRNAVVPDYRESTMASIVQEFQNVISSAIDEGWISRIDDLLKLESGPRLNIENVSYKFVDRFDEQGEYIPFFTTGEIYRAVASDAQWAIDESGNLIVYANNRWGRGRGSTISATESIDFAGAWSRGVDASQRRVLVLDAETIKDSLRGAGLHEGEVELAASSITRSLVVPAGKFKILDVPASWPAYHSVSTEPVGTIAKQVNPTRQSILAELRMVAAGAPIESTRFLKNINLSRTGFYRFANTIDESGLEVSEVTPELLQTLGLDRNAIEVVNGKAKVTVSYGDILHLIKKRGFVAEPARADTLQKVQKISEVAAIVGSANDVVAKTRRAFTPEQIGIIRKHLTNSSGTSPRFRIKNLDKTLKAAGVNVDELPQVLQDIVRFNGEKELSQFVDEEIAGYGDLLNLFNRALRDIVKNKNSNKLEMLKFYLQPSNKRLRLVLLDGSPVRMQSMDEIEQLFKEAALTGVRSPRYAGHVRAQRRSWMTSAGETRPTLVPEGESEVFTVVVGDEIVEILGNLMSGMSRGTGIYDDIGRSGLTAAQQESLNSFEVVYNAIVAANPLMDERTKRLLRIYFDGIDSFLVANAYQDMTYSNLVSLVPLSTIGFTNKKDAETIAGLLRSWEPTLGQYDSAQLPAMQVMLGSTTGKIGKPFERNKVPFVTHRADPTVVTVTDNSKLQNFGHRVEEATDGAVPTIDPDEDFANTMASVLMRSFVDREGSLMHELAVPLFNDDFGVQTMASVAPSTLPRGLYAPKEFIADENAVDRFTTKWFERINNAVAALAREPMYLYHFANAYAGAKINMQALRTAGLDDFIGTLLPDEVDRDDLQAVWAMIPSEFQRELNTGEDLVDAVGNLVQRNLLDENNPVVEFLISNEQNGERLIAWMRQENHIQDAIVLDASKRAMNDIIPYIDDHKVRSLFQDKYRNVFPFLFAQESFLKRWIRSAMYDPAAIRRAQLLAHGVTNSMWTEEDDYGNKYFVIPGTQTLYELFAKDIPFLNKFVQPIPTTNPKIGFNVKRILPGIPGDFQNLPALSPVAMVPVNAIVRHYPELGPTFEIFTTGYPVDTSGNFITETLKDFIPPNYIRGFAAMANMVSGGELGQQEVTSARIAAQSQLESEAARIRSEAAKLEAEGDIEGAVEKFDLADRMAPPPNATERVIEQHLDMVKNWSWRNLFVRAFMGWSFGSTGQNIFAKEGLRKEFIDLMQQMPFDDALAVFYAEHPFDAPYTVFKTERTVEAPLPRTNAAADWMIANKEWIDQHKNAAPWLIPSPKANDEYSARAQNMYIAADLVNYKDLDNWYDDFKYAVGANEYFPLKLQYDVRIAQTGTASEREKLRAEWRVIADGIKLDNPIFARRMTENVNDRSLDVLNEMRLIFNTPENQRPNIQNKEPLSALTNLYFEYKNFYEGLKGSNTTYARRQREILRNDFFAAGAMLVSLNPETRSFWNSIVLPATDLVSEWEIRQALGD